MDWRGRNVLVTGAAGFLGSNLCHALANLGAHIRAVDVLLSGSGANLANLDGLNIDLVQADTRDVDFRPLCEGAEVIFNLAAQTSHMGGQHDPLGDLGINAVAQLRMIRAARDAAPAAIVVHASTRQFYGRVKQLPVNEDQPVAPPDANGVSKFAGEQYWMLEHRLHGRPVVSLRLTNCYGPRQRIRDARQTFLGDWLRCALEHRPFQVWGGEQLRDLAYVDDVTEAFLLAAATPACHGRTFNIGGAAPVSLRQIADRLVQAVGDKARYEICEFPAERAGIDIGSYHADDKAFRQATGWTASVSLDEGLRRTIDWFRAHLAAYL